jgi:putative hemolysin
MEIVIILILILANGILALSEISFVSARREIIEMFQAQGNRRASSILRMMDEPEKFLSSIQIGITLVGVVSGAYGGTVLADDLYGIIKQAGFAAVG